MTREIVARGATLAQAFTEAALGVFALAADPAGVAAREVREVRAHGPSLPALLAHLIGECAYLQEIEDFACHTIDLAVFEVDPRPGGEPMRLHAFLHGEPLVSQGQGPAAMISAVSSREISIQPIADGYEIRVLVAAG
jgi:SHS2 domain-containing protein